MYRSLLHSELYSLLLTLAVLSVYCVLSLYTVCALCPALLSLYPLYLVCTLSLYSLCTCTLSLYSLCTIIKNRNYVKCVYMRRQEMRAG
jgi:hypothetical protein